MSAPPASSRGSKGTMSSSSGVRTRIAAGLLGWALAGCAGERLEGDGAYDAGDTTGTGTGAETMAGTFTTTGGESRGDGDGGQTGPSSGGTTTQSSSAGDGGGADDSGEGDDDGDTSGSADDGDTSTSDGTDGGDSTGGEMGCRSNDDCEENEYCAFSDNECGMGTAGDCTMRPEICNPVSAPVCGCDDKTHDNDCAAASMGVDVASAGAC